MERKITVLTPSYNRAYCLENAYNSMEKQLNKDFIWLIIDDGSTDNTTEVVNDFKKRASFEIQYMKQENGGKHRALNLGISNIKTELVLFLDSDDYLTDDAIDKVLGYHNKVESFEGICGYSFLKIKSSGEIIGKKFPKDYYIDNHIDCRFNKDVSGDKAEVYFTEILKEYPFPEIEGEKFITEAIVWSKIGRKYNTVYINEPLIVCEYLADGLTFSSKKIRLNSPKGMALFYNENSDNAYKESIREVCKKNYVAYSLLAGEKLDDIKKNALNELSEKDIEEGINLYNSFEVEKKEE